MMYRRTKISQEQRRIWRDFMQRYQETLNAAGVPLQSQAGLAELLTWIEHGSAEPTSSGAPCPRRRDSLDELAQAVLRTFDLSVLTTWWGPTLRERTP